MSHPAVAVFTRSNMGANAVTAGLALLRRDLSLCHTAEQELALAHVGVGLGLIDGGNGQLRPWCDGIPPAANAAVVEVLRVDAGSASTTIHTAGKGTHSMTPHPNNIANLARLHTLMDQAGLDAVVLRSGQNFTYLSGVVYPGTLQRHVDLTDSTRPVVLLWPRHGRPVLLANKIAAGLAERDGWIADIVLYEAYVDSPQEKLVEVLRDAGLAAARVGFEKDYFSAIHWDAIQE
eukprot:gene21856-42021_t